MGTRDGAGSPPACRTHARGVPTMDGCWYYLHTFRVKTTRACLVRADGCSVLLRPRSETRTTGRAPAAFTRKMSPRIQHPSIVGTPLVCVLHARVRPVPSRTTHADVRPACLRASCMPARVRPVPSRTTRADVRPACLCASCMLVGFLCHHAPHTPMCVLHACVRPACLPACALRHHAPHAPCVRPVPSCTTRAGVRPACPRASCAISHHTRRCASCVARRLAWCYLSSKCRSPESACPFQRPTSRCRLKASLRRSLSDRSAAHC